MDRDQLLVGAIVCWFLLASLVLAFLSCTILAHRREIKAAQDKKNEEGVEDEQTTLQCHLSAEVTKEALQECYGDDLNLTWSQLRSFAWSVVRAFGNLGLLTHACLVIGPLHKGKPWDLEKHIVVYGEGFFSVVYLGTMIVQIFIMVGHCHREDWKMFAADLAVSKDLITISANFSFLKLLPLAQPEAAWKFLSRIMAQDMLGKVNEISGVVKIGLYAFVILNIILFVSLALMSV